MWSPTHVQVTVQRARGLLTKGKNRSNDCFVTIGLGKEKYQTSVKEKASQDVEWHEECELLIPEHGNTAEIVLTALHRNFLGVDEFLGTVSIPLSSFDVYERPRNRWYTLGSKPGKEKTKERGELEVRIGFIVKAGSLTDLTRKEKHKSSLGQLSTAAQSIGGSLLSIGSLEKRKGFKKLAKSLGNRVKGKSKSKLSKEELDEREEHRYKSRQEPGEADPGVISEDEDEFTFDDLSHKSSASSLNASVLGINSGNNSIGNGPGSGSGNGNSNGYSGAPSATRLASNYDQSESSGGGTESAVQTAAVASAGAGATALPSTPPALRAPTNATVPHKPPRYSMSSSTTSLSKLDNLKEDEWGLKLYGKQAGGSSTATSGTATGTAGKRWESKSTPKIVIDESGMREERREEPSPASSPLPPESSSPPVPREMPQPRGKEDRISAGKEKSFNESDRAGKERKEEKQTCRSPKEEKHSKRDRKKERASKHSSSERIIIGGEDGTKTAVIAKSRLPHELLAQFEGKSREDLIELTLQLQAVVDEQKRQMADYEDYIDSLLLRVIECSPRLLQKPFHAETRFA